MSNPDERTAIDQFGTGDKYFGVSTLLATLPGLPMLGHGQIEGFTEKYGMEYKQARMRETPNEELVGRHQREIAPLLKKRWAFAESGNFALYDFWNEHGGVDENVFAYSNVSGGERSLVLYNNVYGSTRGTVHVSAASMDKGWGTMRQRSLAEAMQLPGDPGAIVGYRDTTAGLEYLRRAGGLIESGFSTELRGYQYVVLQQWREMTVTAEQPWDRLCDALHGAGVYNLGEALSKLRLRPVHDALRQMLSVEAIGELVAAAGAVPGNPKLEPGTEESAPKRGKKGVKEAAGESADPRMEGVLGRVEAFLDRADELRGGNGGAVGAEARPGQRERLRTGLRAVLELPGLQSASPVWPAAATAILPGGAGGELRVATWATILAWAVMRELDGDGGSAAGGGVRTFDELQFRSALAEIFSGLGVTGEDAWRAAARVRVLLRYGNEAQPGGTEDFWKDGDVRWLASVNESGETMYFNQEAFAELLWWMEIPVLVRAAETRPVRTEAFAEVKQRMGALSRTAAEAGYEVTRYVGLVGAAESAAEMPESATAFPVAVRAGELVPAPVSGRVDGAAGGKKAGSGAMRPKAPGRKKPKAGA